ncbi:MAG: ParB/RepB/Spo0J family partition protein [Oscillospiraceae bacterium]
MAVKKGLGKGLDSLFLDNSTKIESSGAELVRITDIEPNRNQPRKDFDENALMQLADSIREHGLIQPILVRPLNQGGYQIIAGERRWRACRMVGITQVPVNIKDFDDVEAMEIALIENLQREDLNVMEEAFGYQELMESYNMTQDEVSKSVGKSRSAVANCLRLLNLPDEVVTMLRDGKLSAGHARALLALESEEKIIEFAQNVVKKQWTVRDTESAVKLANKAITEKPKPIKLRDSFFDEIELSLKDEIGRVVKVKEKKEKGILEIEFYDKDDLKEIVKKLSK